MNPQAKKPSAPAASTAPTSATTGAASTTGARRPWIKKSPVEVVLGEIGKQEQKVAEMRKELAHEERGLAKLQQAKKLLEAE
jgi:hypothetical protein